MALAAREHGQTRGAIGLVLVPIAIGIGSFSTTRQVLYQDKKKRQKYFLSHHCFPKIKIFPDLSPYLLCQNIATDN